MSVNRWVMSAEVEVFMFGEVLHDSCRNLVYNHMIGPWDFLFSLRIKRERGFPIGSKPG